MQLYDNLRHGQQDKTQTNLDWEGKSAAAGAREEVEMVFKLLEHAAANVDHRIKKFLLILLSFLSINMPRE